MKKLLAVAIFSTLLLAGCVFQAQPSQLKVLPTPGAGSDGSVTMAQVANHASKEDCWLAIRGSAYDVSNFTSHPGGGAYVQYCGKDATQAFETKDGRGKNHSQSAQSMMAQFLIGPISQ